MRSASDWEDNLRKWADSRFSTEDLGEGVKKVVARAWREAGKSAVWCAADKCYSAPQDRQLLQGIANLSQYLRIYTPL